MVIRLTGLSSGMDTQALIDQLMEIERIPQYRLEGNIDREQDKLTAWTSVESALNTLSSKVESLESYTTWQQMSVTSADESILSATADNSAANGDYSVSVSQLATVERYNSSAQASTTDSLGFTGGSFDINGQTVTLTDNYSLNDVRDAINMASLDMDDVDKVEAKIIGTTLVLENAQSGSATNMSLSDELGSTILSDLDALSNYTAGKDLEANINGIDVTSASNTGITDFIEGVTFNFTKETDVGETINLNVSKDTDSLKEKIQEFVTAYNDAMGAIKTQSEVNLSSEGEIDSVSMLQGDSLLRGISDRARSMITDTIETGEGMFKSLRDIGIWTSGSDNTISIVDSEKLDDALMNNLDEVETLFRDRTDTGIIRQMDEYLSALTAPDGTIANRKSTIQSAISDRQDSIVDLEDRLVRYEDALYAQFGAMEEAIGRMQSQSDFLTSMLPGA